MEEKIDKRNALRVARKSLQAALALLDVVEGDDEHERADDVVRHDRTPLGKRRTLDLIHAGQLAASHVGRHYFVKRAELDDYFARQRVTKGASAATVANDGDSAADVLAEIGLVEVRPTRARKVAGR